MTAPTVRLTTAEAIVRYLIAQRTVVDGRDVPLVPGVFAIFGHGNVTCLGPALYEVRDVLPTWRGQNEQGMTLAATAVAKWWSSIVTRSSKPIGFARPGTNAPWSPYCSPPCSVAYPGVGESAR